MIMQSVAKIEWKDYTESIPAFLITVGIPFSYSIADRLALGFISYAIVKGFSGRAREIGWLTYLLAIVLVDISSLCEAEWASVDLSFLRLRSERQRRFRGRSNSSTSKRRNPPTKRIAEVESHTKEHQDRCVRSNVV
jgi:hypothetical protein